MRARISAGLILLALFASHWISPGPKASPISRLEKSCLYQGNALPCFIMDEALQTTWSI